jgi:hypothetical protein
MTDPPERRRGVSIIHNTVLHLPRPGDAGMVGLRLEACTTWAPSTERDGCTDIWCGGRKLTVALPFAEVDRIMTESNE